VGRDDAHRALPRFAEVNGFHGYDGGTSPGTPLLRGSVTFRVLRTPSSHGRSLPPTPTGSPWTLEAVHIAPWCEWLRTRTGAVLAASLRWPADGSEDDDVLAEALDGLRRASVALGRAARGETAEAPLEPAPEPAPPEESDDQRRIQLHREALAAARP
jgi:hypothetical protein